MRIFERIVIPLEPNSRAQALLGVASELARKFTSDFILISVNPLGTGVSRSSGRIRELRKQLETWSTTLIDAGASSVTTMSREGNPALNIEQVALEKAATLILMAEDSENTEARAWFGTTTQKLARRLPTPLLVIRADSRPKLDPILAVVDFSDSSRRALQHAIALARSLETHLTILHVIPDALRSPLEEGSVWSLGAPVPALASTGEARRGFTGLSYDLLARSPAEAELKLEGARAELREFLAAFDLSRVSYESRVLAGAPVTETLSQASSMGAGLIIAGSGPRAGAISLISQTTAETLVELSDIPVMIFQSHPERRATTQDHIITRSQYI